jgi:hypothetical protein
MADKKKSEQLIAIEEIEKKDISPSWRKNNA